MIPRNGNNIAALNGNDDSPPAATTTTTTLLYPDFDRVTANKINDRITVVSPHVLEIQKTQEYHSAIATSGFPADRDGTYVFATKILAIGSGAMMIGFTDKSLFDAATYGFPGWNGLTGTALGCYAGQVYPRRIEYVAASGTRQAKEVVSILVISNNGSKKEVQWVVDGIMMGPVVDCGADFGKGPEIFPLVSFGSNNQKIECVQLCDVAIRSSN